MAVVACGGVPPLSETFEAPGGAAVIRVPEAQPTIQAGVDAARDGDVVLVAPGFYFEKVKIEGKHVTVATWYLASSDPIHREKTIVSGRGAAFEVKGGPDDVGEVRIVGFTLRNAKFGVVAHDAAVRVEDNRIYSNAREAIVGSNARLTITRNEIRDHANGAGVLVNGASTLLAEDNRLDRNVVGFELMFHPHKGERLELRVRGNQVTRSTGGGVAMAGYEEPSDRVVWIERNVFDRSGAIAVGCNQISGTRAPTDGAALNEPIFVVQNTFVRNSFGLIGGDNVVALNNLFVGTTHVALLRLRERSVVERNGFWSNGLDSEDVPRSRRLRAVDPLLDKEYRLQAGSPAIDAGLASYTHDGITVLPLGSYTGEAPDLGAFER
jgi:hypothetical protein